MKAKLANYEKISETMTATLQLAKDTAENVKKNARRNADILIANAKADSEKQIKDAQDYRRTLIHNMMQTEGNMKSYVGKIRKDLELALAAIDELDRMKAPLGDGAAQESPAEAETEAAEDEESGCTNQKDRRDVVFF